MIDLLPGEDQQALLDSFSDFLASETPVEAGAPKDVWGRIAELGWLSLSLAEEAGGAGLGAAEEMLLLRECGRFLLTPGLMATLGAIRIACRAGDSALAGRFVDGSARAALALPAPEGGLYVIDGHDAGFMLAIGDLDVRLCEISEAGHAVAPSDERVSLHRVAGGRQIGTACSTAWARVMIAAQLVGVAEAVRDMAAEYARTRTQFDQPIGAFQAIKHFCADMAIRAEAAYAQTSYAALCLAENGECAETECAAALRVAADAAIQSAESNIQLHGAMGVTEECHAHLYLKRAHLLAQFGSRAVWQTKALLAR